jgi:hypothetical protein
VKDESEKHVPISRYCSVEGCDQRHDARGYCKGHYSRLIRRGNDIVLRKTINPGRKGKISHGYFHVYKPNHPNAQNTGYIREHRYVMSKHLGRPLFNDEQVHHKNGDKLDNRIENLELKIGNHGSGQTVEDMVKWAREILSKYG